MPIPGNDGRKAVYVARTRALLVRATAATAIAGLIAVSVAPAAFAQQAGQSGDGDNTNAWNKFMRTIGVQKPPDQNADIDYRERAPLVVPPSRDLPSPETASAQPIGNWPKDPAKRDKTNKGKAEVVPQSAVQTPNPPHKKKPWYNPVGWFDKEEYAAFTGEPVRQDLTDPPAGYRSPSPDYPYGIAPDKKAYTPTSKDFSLGQIGGK
jgi:hypothetical protein